MASLFYTWFCLDSEKLSQYMGVLKTQGYALKPLLSPMLISNGIQSCFHHLWVLQRQTWMPNKCIKVVFIVSYLFTLSTYQPAIFWRKSSSLEKKINSLQFRRHTSHFAPRLPSQFRCNLSSEARVCLVHTGDAVLGDWRTSRNLGGGAQTKDERSLLWGFASWLDHLPKASALNATILVTGRNGVEGINPQ